MTDTAPLRDYSASRAVLLGAWDYTDLTPIPAAQHSLRRMADLLSGPWCQWPRNQVSVWRNEPRPGDLPDRLVTTFAQATDAALFYFVGHGLIDDDDELCLALAGTVPDPARRATTGLPFSAVRRALLRSPATTKILILDCCYSGQAILRENALSHVREQVLDLTARTGAYTMAASGAFNTAWYETDPTATRPQTYFTKYLADLVETGIRGAPQDLSVAQVFRHVQANLTRDRKPAPVDRNVDAAYQFIFARNAAASSTTAPPADQPTTPHAPAAVPTPADATPVTYPDATAQPDPEPARHVTSATRRGTAIQTEGLALAEFMDLAAADPPDSMVLDSHSSHTVAFSPDGRTLAVDAYHHIYLWDTQTRTRSAVLSGRTQRLNAPQSWGSDTITVDGHDGDVLTLAFSPDGYTLASGDSQGHVFLWNLSTGMATRELKGHRDRMASLAFSSDGRTLASGGADKSIRLWATMTGASTILETDAGRIDSLVFTPDGHILASGNDWGEVRLWDLANSESIRLAQLQGPVSLAFGPDGRTLASAGYDKVLRLWDVKTRRITATLPGHTDAIHAIAFSPDGRTLASAGRGKVIRLWNATTGTNTATLPGHSETVTSLAFSPDTRTLASCSRDNTVRLWNVTDL